MDTSIDGATVARRWHRRIVHALANLATRPLETIALAPPDAGDRDDAGDWEQAIFATGSHGMIRRYNALPTVDLDQPTCFFARTMPGTEDVFSANEFVRRGVI